MTFKCDLYPSNFVYFRKNKHCCSLNGRPYNVTRFDRKWYIYIYIYMCVCVCVCVCVHNIIFDMRLSTE